MSALQDILDKDTYHRYLQRLDARALLEYYGAQNCTEQFNKDGTTEIVHSCLLDRVEPHHANGDQSPSASCNLDKKKYVCYSMGFGCDLFHLVMKLEGKERFADSMTTVGQFLTGATLDQVAFRDKLVKQFDSPLAYAINLPSYDETILRSFDHPHNYWTSRGISSETITGMHLGYDPHTKRVVFPHYVDKTLVGWQKRVVPGETFPDFPKYKNSPGFPKSETLYNFDLARFFATVVVVESPMSVARANTLGLPNVVATFGAKVTAAQVAKLTGFQCVYVWFDRDGAGIKGEHTLIDGLYRHTDVRVVAPERGRDMGDAASQDEILAKLFQARPAALRLGEYEAARRMR